jgi:hypothetical protein
MSEQLISAISISGASRTVGICKTERESEKELMRLNCPACGEPFEDESELGATLKLIDHLKSIPETEHIAQLAGMLRDLEHLVAQDDGILKATANAEVRDVIFDRCARFEERLRTIQLLTVSTLTVAVEQTREMLQECGDFLGIRSRRAGEALLHNLQESLLVADRKFKQ